MFNLRPKTEPSELDEAITIALQQLENVYAYSDEYHKIVTEVERLYALKINTIVLGNLLGIVFIVGYERANVVTSKAVGFVMKAAR
jgi:hypothetical protein